MWVFSLLALLLVLAGFALDRQPTLAGLKAFSCMRKLLSLYGVPFGCVEQVLGITVINHVFCF